LELNKSIEEHMLTDAQRHNLIQQNYRNILASVGKVVEAEGFSEEKLQFQEFFAEYCQELRRMLFETKEIRLDDTWQMIRLTEDFDVMENEREKSRRQMQYMRHVLVLVGRMQDMCQKKSTKFVAEKCSTCVKIYQVDKKIGVLLDVKIYCLLTEDLDAFRTRLSSAVQDVKVHSQHDFAVWFGKRNAKKLLSDADVEHVEGLQEGDNEDDEDEKEELTAQDGESHGLQQQKSEEIVDVENQRKGEQW